MSPLDMDRLDRRTIAVELEVNGRPILVKGVATRAEFPVLGTVLQISVKDPAGDFELLFQEAEWPEDLQPGTEFNCDYFVSLARHAV